MNAEQFRQLQLDNEISRQVRLALQSHTLEPQTPDERKANIKIEQEKQAFENRYRQLKNGVNRYFREAKRQK